MSKKRYIIEDENCGAEIGSFEADSKEEAIRKALEYGDCGIILVEVEEKFDDRPISSYIVTIKAQVDSILTEEELSHRLCLALSEKDDIEEIRILPKETIVDGEENDDFFEVIDYDICNVEEL